MEKGKGVHEHIVLVRDDGTGYSSKNANHVHELIVIPAIPPGLPITDAPFQLDIEMLKDLNLVTETQDGIFIFRGNKALQVLMPTKIGGHYHLLEPLPEQDKAFVKEANERVVEKNIALLEESKRLNKKYIEDGEQSEKYYCNDQWEKGARDRQKKKDAPALTINKISPMIRTLVGYAQQNPTVIKYRPTEDGDLIAADMFNALAYYFLDRNDFQYEKSEIFSDQVITGRGNFHLYIDWNVAKYGSPQIIIEHFPWNDVFYGEHHKRNAEDIPYVVLRRWVSFDDLKAMYPDKSEQIQSDFDFFESVETGKYSDDEIRKRFDYDPEIIDVKRKKIRLYEIQERVYQNVTVLANVDEDLFLNDRMFDDEQKSSILSMPGFVEIPNQTVDEIKVTHIAGRIVLDQYISQFTDLTAIPAYADKRGDKVWGKVKELEDPQDELNKWRSTMSDVASKTMGKNTFYDSSTFSDPSEEDSYRENAGKVGGVYQVNNTRNIPVRDEGSPYPSGLERMADVYNSDMREVSGVNQEVLGIPSSAQSDILFRSRIKQSLVGNDYIFQGMSLAQKKLGKLLLQAFKIALTPDRVYRILNNINISNKNEPITLNGLPVEKYTKEQIKEIWMQTDFAQYDVVVSESQQSPSKRVDDFSQWAALASQGVAGVDAEFLVTLSDLPEKDRFLQISRQAKEAQMQIEMAKLQAEENKTLIAAQSRNQQQQQQQFQ